MPELRLIRGSKSARLPKQTPVKISGKEIQQIIEGYRKLKPFYQQTVRDVVYGFQLMSQKEDAELRLISGKNSACSPPVNDPQSIYNQMKTIASADREHFYVLHLDSGGRIIRKELAAIGSQTKFVTHPREVFRRAVTHGSHSIICVHNHPSGNVTPSPQDKRMTEGLAAAGKIMGIPLVDHIIIGKEGFYSFNREGK